MAAISIDIAFVVIVFAAVFSVRPDLREENGKSLLEFRDPLSLRPRLENVNVREDENR